MIFESLFSSANKGELILVEGGFCRWHLRRDGQLTIYEILVLSEYQRQGIGSSMLETLKHVPGAMSIVAKCPVDLDSNSWYAAMGFTCIAIEQSHSGRGINVWRYQI